MSDGHITVTMFEPEHIRIEEVAPFNPKDLPNRYVVYGVDLITRDDPIAEIRKKHPFDTDDKWEVLWKTWKRQYTDLADWISISADIFLEVAQIVRMLEGSEGKITIGQKQVITQIKSS